MAYKCIVCGKGPKSGKNVSHSKKATPRFFRPNLQKIRIKLDGVIRKGYVCTRCLRSELVEKVI